MVEAEIYFDNHLSNQAYHARKGISSSFLKSFIQESPFHAWAKYISPDRQILEPTPAMVFGSACHDAILLPDMFARQYVCKPEGLNLATKEGKAWKEENADKTILPYQDYTSIGAMRDAVMLHPACKSAFHAPHVETSTFWSHDNGLECKTRFDICSHHAWVYDLKTCGDASPKGFAKQIATLGYHIQAYFYLLGYKKSFGVTPKGFRFIAVEKSYPYAVAVYECTDAMLDTAKDIVEPALDRVLECIASESWPGYDDREVVLIDLPAWAI